MKTKLVLLVLLFVKVSFSQINWYPSSDGLPLSYKPVDFAKAANGDIYLLCHKSQTSGEFAKLLKSVNNGTNWTEVTMSGLPNMIPRGIISSGGKFFVSGYNSNTFLRTLYASSDNGLNWSSSDAGIPANFSLSDLTAAANGDLFLAANESVNGWAAARLLKSTDSGVNWVNVDLSSLGTKNEVSSLVYLGSKLFMACYTYSASSPYTDLFASSDAGQTWSLSNNGMSSSYLITDLAITTTGELFSIGNQKQGLMTTTVITVMNSTDNGANWDEIPMSGHTTMTLATTMIQTNGPLLIAGVGASTFTNYIFSNAVPTGIRNDSKKLISIFPNPANTSITLNAEQQFIASVKEVNILSVDGKIVKTFKYGIESMDVSDVPAGIYQIQIHSDDAIRYSQLVKISR